MSKDVISTKVTNKEELGRGLSTKPFEGLKEIFQAELVTLMSEVKDTGTKVVEKTKSGAKKTMMATAVVAEVALGAVVGTVHAEEAVKLQDCSKISDELDKKICDRENQRALRRAELDRKNAELDKKNAELDKELEQIMKERENLLKKLKEGKIRLAKIETENEYLKKLGPMMDFLFNIMDMKVISNQDKQKAKDYILDIKNNKDLIIGLTSGRGEEMYDRLNKILVIIEKKIN